MNIQSIGFKGVNVKADIAKKESQPKENNFIEIPIKNNTLNDVMGRSQVNFKGHYKMHNNIFEYHDGSRLTNEKKNIVYDKKTGTMKYEEFDKKGNKVKTINCNPVTQETDEMTVLDDGTVVKKFQSPDLRTYEKISKDKKYHCAEVYNYVNNTKEFREVDLKRNREVYSKSEFDKTKTIVVDLTTGKEVTSGPLIYDKKYSDDNNSWDKINILTGFVTEHGEITDSGHRVEISQFSEETKNITKSVEKFDDIEIVKKYDENGDIESKVVNMYDLDGNLSKQSFYNLEHDAIEKEKFYSNNTLETILYNPKTGNPIKKQQIVDGALRENFEYSVRTGRIKSHTIFDKNQYKTINYNADGIRTSFEEYSNDGSLISEGRYSSVNGEILSKTFYKLKNPSIYMHNEYSNNYISRQMLYEKNTDNLLESRAFYSNTHELHYWQKYKSDGSYTKVEYDRDGNIISEKEYNSDGSRKASNKNFFDFNFVDNNSNKKKTSNVDVHDLIDKMLYVASSSDLDLFESFSKEELDAFAKYIELDSIDSLINASPKVKRDLIKRYHPDANIDNSDKQQEGQKIFEILNQCFFRQ